jgi:hypothetical protein
MKSTFASVSFLLLLVSAATNVCFGADRLDRASTAVFDVTHMNLDESSGILSCSTGELVTVQLSVTGLTPGLWTSLRISTPIANGAWGTFIADSTGTVSFEWGLSCLAGAYEFKAYQGRDMTKGKMSLKAVDGFQMQLR